jgi:hypothetical protein
VIALNRCIFATAMKAIICHDLRQIVFDLDLAVDPAVSANYLATGMTIA